MPAVNPVTMVATFASAKQAVLTAGVAEPNVAVVPYSKYHCAVHGSPSGTRLMTGGQWIVPCNDAEVCVTLDGVSVVGTTGFPAEASDTGMATTTRAASTSRIQRRPSATDRR